MTNSNTVSATWEKPLAPPDSIPEAADIVVIGGGIVGASTAWFLAKQGVASNRGVTGAGSVSRDVILARSR